MPRDDLHRLALHSALVTLAWTLSAAFSAVFLFRAGLPLTQIFLTFACTMASRFVLRPLVLISAPVIGLRSTFILGTVICGLSYPTLSLVHTIGWALIVFVLLTAIGQVFYCTCYHVLFTALSANSRRGAQVGAFQVINTLAAVLGPAAGGLLLARHGPLLSFGAAMLIAFAAVVPLLQLEAAPIAREKPVRAYAAAKRGVKLYFADGWIQVFVTSAWSIVLFRALHQQYDSFGGTLSLAAVGGAAGGYILGRFIDRGHSRRAVWINAAFLTLVVGLRASTFGNPTAAVAVAIVTAMVGGFYLPSWMTAAYNDARFSPCSFRFQFAAEGGWDAGAALAGLTAAAASQTGVPLDVTILLALPMVGLQAALLNQSYAQAAGWRETASSATA